MKSQLESASSSLDALQRTQRKHNWRLACTAALAGVAGAMLRGMQERRR